MAIIHCQYCDRDFEVPEYIEESECRERIFNYLEGWCEHTTNPIQRRYLCKACREALKEEVDAD